MRLHLPLAPAQDLLAQVEISREQLARDIILGVHTAALVRKTEDCVNLDMVQAGGPEGQHDVWQMRAEQQVSLSLSLSPALPAPAHTHTHTHTTLRARTHTDMDAQVGLRRHLQELYPVVASRRRELALVCVCVFVSECV